MTTVMFYVVSNDVCVIVRYFNMNVPESRQMLPVIIDCGWHISKSLAVVGWVVQINRYI